MKRNLLKAIGISFLIFVILSWIIPVGTYTSGELETNGIDAVGIFDLFSIPISTILVFATYIIVFAVIGGLYGVMSKTGALDKLTDKLAGKFSKKEKTFLVITIIFYVLLSSVTGLIIPLFVLVPLSAMVLFKLNFTKVVAMASTVGSILIGSAASTFGFNISGYTKNLLQENGIDAYFSGCMTLTLDRFNGIEKEDYILLVDVKDEIYENIKKLTKKRIERITNNLKLEEHSELNWEQRKEKVEEYLKKIQKASLVITPRLHCALPALALETPVLFIDYSLNNDRTGDFLRLLNVVKEDDFSGIKLRHDINKPKENKKDYLKIRNKLEQECFDFIKNLDEERINSIKLPEIEDYKEFVKINEFQKKLLLESFNDVNELYKKEIENSKTAWAVSNEGWKNYEDLCKKLDEKNIKID